MLRGNSDLSQTYDSSDDTNQVVLQGLALQAGEVCSPDIVTALLQEFEVWQSWSLVRICARHGASRHVLVRGNSGKFSMLRLYALEIV